MPPPLSYARKALSAGRENCNFDKSKKDHAAQWGRDAGESGHTPQACIHFLRLFFRDDFSGSTRQRCDRREKARVSACEPLCAIFL